jgi:hypothetical protein
MVGLVSGETLRRLFCVALDNLDPPTNQPQRTISKSSMPRLPLQLHDTAQHHTTEAVLSCLLSDQAYAAAPLCKDVPSRYSVKLRRQAHQSHSSQGRRAASKLSSTFPPQFLHTSSTAASGSSLQKGGRIGHTGRIPFGRLPSGMWFQSPLLIPSALTCSPPATTLPGPTRRPSWWRERGP